MIAWLKKFSWTVPFVCFIAGYFSLTKLYPVKEMEAPLVVGKTLQEACTILALHTLNSRLIGLKEDPLLPNGTIISQTPQAGQKIKPHQAVFIVASTQPEKSCAGSYVNKKVSEIEQDLAHKNIRAKLYTLPSIAPKDSCIAQWPEAGLPLENNKMILYISHAINKPIIIPDMRNKPVLDVIEFLKNNAIEVDLVHNTQEQSQDHVCTNCIINDQRPLAGSIITIDARKPLHVQLHAKHQ